MRRCATVAAAAVLSHAGALTAGYVWLDHAHIEGGAAIEPPSRWLHLFTHGFAKTGFYRPLVSLSLSLDALAGSPFVFHAENLLWHGAASAMLVKAADALGLERRAAWVAGLLFALHPVGTIVAGAIAFRAEAMTTLALLTLVWAHLRGRWATAGIALLAGALVKELALAFAPLAIIALEIARRSRSIPAAPRARAVFVAEGAALTAALTLRFLHAPRWRASFEDLDASDAIGTRLASLTKSIRTLVFPYELDVCDSFALEKWWRPASVGGALLACVIAYYAWRRQGPALLFGLALLPSLQLVPIMRWWSPHYLYLPLAFFAMLVSELVMEYTPRRRAAVVGALSAVLATGSFVQSLRFKDDSTLWEPQVARDPTCREGQFYLAERARMARDLEGAAHRYEAALAMKKRVLAFVDRTAALQNLGVVRLEQRRFADARAAFEEALTGAVSDASRTELLHNLAAAQLQAGDPAAAERTLRPVVERSDAPPESLALMRVIVEALAQHR